MIDKLEIKNLKSINKLEMYLRNFNIFTGTNSSGKSSTNTGVTINCTKFREWIWIKWTISYNW